MSEGFWTAGRGFLLRSTDGLAAIVHRLYVSAGRGVHWKLDRIPDLLALQGINCFQRRGIGILSGVEANG